MDSDVSADMGATSTDGSSWTNTTARLRYKIRGRTYYGVYGNSTNYFGVFGYSTNYYGVYGYSTNNIGVYGISTNYFGVYGSSTNNIGVRGISTNYYGVYGASTTNRSGYFYRNSDSATTANFEIISDHTGDDQTVLRFGETGVGIW